MPSKEVGVLYYFLITDPFIFFIFPVSDESPQLRSPNLRAVLQCLNQVGSQPQSLVDTVGRTSRPLYKLASGRIGVKVTNHWAMRR